MTTKAEIVIFPGLEDIPVVVDEIDRFVTMFYFQFEGRRFELMLIDYKGMEDFSLKVDGNWVFNAKKKEEAGAMIRDALRLAEIGS